MEKSKRPGGMLLHRIAMMILAAGVATIAACIEKTPAPKTESSEAPADTHGLPTLVIDFCTRQDWTATCTIPEFTDDQRLNNGQDKYGPVVYTIPADDLGARTALSFMTIGAAAASIIVDTTGGPLNLPQSYRNLNLTTGWNCVYLKSSNAAGAMYDGYIVPGQTTGKPCPDISTPPASVLRVAPVMHNQFSTAADVPPVARFHEANFAQASQSPQPVFGVKCDNKWCIVSPTTQTIVRPILHRAFNQNMNKWAVRGWSDQQHLALMPNPNTPTISTLEASIVPEIGPTTTSETAFEPAFVRAATVYFASDPAGTKYATKWGFGKDLNEVWIQKVGPTAWVGKIRSYGTGCTTASPCWKPVIVKRTDHNGIYPPAIARFRWDPLDEGVWVRCDDGCCKVSAQ